MVILLFVLEAPFNKVFADIIPWLQGIPILTKDIRVQMPCEVFMRSNKRVAVLLLMGFLFTFQIVSRAQISVTSNQVATALVQKLAGQGVTISNPTLNCAGQANGLFKVVSSNLGLDSGIVLTTGRVETQGDQYGIDGLASELASNNDNFPGDSMLVPLALHTTYDACDLEFDFVPNGDTVKFQYVFSSEEYRNSVCGPYNDAFAFFISGPGISGYDNMALVPGTSIPVTINTINDGIPGSIGNISNCTAMGTGSPFTSYYIDNSNGTTLTHWGFTKVLQAVHAVTPCVSYHLKIVIADAGDPLYDSGVFLEAGSLKTGNFSVRPVATLPYDTSGYFCVKGCLPGRFRIYSSEISSQPKTIRFVCGGNAIGGFDYTLSVDSVIIPANQLSADVTVNGLPTPAHGTKTLQIFIMSPNLCNGTENIVDSASMLIYDTLHIAMITPDTIICGNDSLQLDAAGDSMLYYSWSPAMGLNNASIQDPVLFTTTTTTYVVTASLPGTSCPVKTADVSVKIKLTPQIELTPDTTLCYNAQLQLNAVMSQGNLYYSYYWSGPNDFTSTMADNEIDNVVAGNSGIYSITVLIDTNHCKSVASVNVTVNVPDVPIVVPKQIFCLNKAADSLVAIGTNLLWYTPQNDSPSVFAPVPPTNEVGSYSYSVTEKVGDCESPKANVEVEIKKCCDGNIFIPNAFTPNGDGLNDRFEPVMDYGYHVNSMYIFNRWGQVIYAGLQDGWDGNFGGATCVVGTYFYKIDFGCILGGTVERTGDITLIR